MYDWIVVGGGITGISLSYELQKQAFRYYLSSNINNFREVAVLAMAAFHTGLAQPQSLSNFVMRELLDKENYLMSWGWIRSFVRLIYY